MATERIYSLLTSVLAEIHEDTQYDDVAEMLEEVEEIIESLSNNPNDPNDSNHLSVYMTNIMDSAYASKGYMPDVENEIREMRDVVRGLLE